MWRKPLQRSSHRKRVPAGEECRGVCADRRASTRKRIRETAAEAVAFVGWQAIGVESRVGSANYISLWNGDVVVLLELVRRTAIKIIAAITLEKSLSPEGGG
ncbi:MAG TPA: hypothetical protein VGR97_02925 [Candidatus Acidoferrales bacterium]|nr:hypothetical protein [Candidatus Acidoferrales bacterium]